MTKYIENVNAYLSQMKIKQTYISLKSGIDTKKLSRVLSGAQPVTDVDMDKIAEALGKRVEYFLCENFSVPQVSDFSSEKIAFYAGDPTVKQNEIAGKLEKLMENIDEIISAKDRFLTMSGE